MKRLIVTDYSLFCLILNSPFPSLMTKCFDLLNCILQIDWITSSKHIPYFSSSWQRTVHAWSAVCLTIYYVSGYSCHIHTYSQTMALTIQALLNFIDYYLNNLYFSFLAHRKYWERTDRKKLKIWRTIGADVWQNASSIKKTTYGMTKIWDAIICFYLTLENLCYLQQHGGFF